MNKQRCPRCGETLPGQAEVCERCGFHGKRHEAEEKGLERRREQRKKLHSHLTVNDELALLIDISKTGMRLSCTRIPGDLRIDIRFEAEDHVFDLKGRIVWHSRQVSFSGTWDIGVSLENPPPDFARYVASIEEPV